MTISLRTLSVWGLVGSCLAPLLGISAPRQAKTAEVRLSVATLHAAALTTPRSPDDTTDDPYLLISILWPHGHASTVHLPTAGHFHIRLDEALGSRLLTDLGLQPGDSVRLLVSVLEGPRVLPAAETEAVTASVAALGHSSEASVSVLQSALAPLRKQGTHWLGSTALLVTNEGGSIYWRALECLATCRVVKAPTGTMFASEDAGSVAGVVELTGDGGTYHLQLQSQRTLDDMRD